MCLDKRKRALCVIAPAWLWVVCSPARGADTIELPAPPSLTENHKTYLTRIARRVLRDVSLGRSPARPEYVPLSLAGVSGEVVVRVWEAGFLRAHGIAPRDSIADAAFDAALAAAEAMKADPPDILTLREMTVEIEASGDAEPVAAPGDWTKPGGRIAWIEPGVHGLVLIGPAEARRIYPSEFIRTDLPLEDALGGLAKMMHMTPDQVGQTRVERFRTQHWVELGASGDVVSLHRGLVLAEPEAIDRSALMAAAAGIAEYMAYRQLNSGLFTYQFDAGANRYADVDNLIGQAGAAYAVALHAKDGGRTSATADLAVQYHLQGFTPISGENSAYIASADGEHKLGLTALVYLALAAHPRSESYTTQREQLANGMLGLQRESGMFLTAFPPAVRINAQDYYPGEALLALAMEYTRKPSDRIIHAFDRALPFYREYFRGGKSPAFVPWQVQAFAEMAAHTKRQDFADYVFELSDWLAAQQLNEGTCRWPELVGGVPDASTGRPGISTALYLQAFADALRLARSREDLARVSAYEGAVRAAARFVVQLQVRPEEAYSIRSPLDAVRGMRTAPELNRLRIDNCQHALVGLIKARRALYPDGD